MSLNPRPPKPQGASGGDSRSRRTTALGRALESGQKTPGAGRMLSDGSGGLMRQGEVAPLPLL